MKLLTAITVLGVLFSAAAYADDGTWNAGASNQLPNGTGGNATSQGQNSSVVCDGGRCFTPRRGR